MITLEDASYIICLMKENDIQIWLDGGWAVDALLEKQSREHNDIDLIVSNDDRERLLKLIKEIGFEEVVEEYTTSNHTVWKDAQNRILDLHFVDFQPDGNVIFENEKFNLEVLEGIGIIGDCEVKCINASSQVLFHCGYVHRPTDDADVKALCEKFGITIPEEYL